MNYTLWLVSLSFQSKSREVRGDESHLKGSNRRKNRKQFTEDSAHTRSIFISGVSLGVTQSSVKVHVAANFVDNERPQVNVLDLSRIKM